ncbi:MAG TPA: 16S rRNA (adenine(1518)-N(6)/adenine(1519)-N(6))-dimethyltransferase RsmA [Candidatus Saccharimonadales bacterium]|nr:16S rRNA (adenine(1518)-N(6)/adenine(1519)-N(6))-dimethyltransferase RsmA [Candidatus Saccharimonadales bacterium]
MDYPKKSLGQHWLKDEATLQAICASAELTPKDTVLEIGPGFGSLTGHLVKRAKQVIAVELDGSLAASLPERFNAQNLEVLQADILKFDLNRLPRDYKVVANIPYYLTSNLLRVLSESVNPPATMTILVQKEVAERICANPGQMSVLAVSVQLFYKCSLGTEVPARLFTPPPKVDSQVVLLKRRPQPLFPDLEKAKFFQIVKAGFSERRKKLRSSLAGGLSIPKGQADEMLKKAGIDGNLRAQELPLEQWHDITRVF